MARGIQWVLLTENQQRPILLENLLVADLDSVTDDTSNAWIFRAQEKKIKQVRCQEDEPQQEYFVKGIENLLSIQNLPKSKIPRKALLL